MKYVGENGEVVSGDNKFVLRYAEICREANINKGLWIAKLRANNIKASHPDDGWVDREKNKVCFMYPQFNDGIDIGNSIALGSPDKYRVVKIIGIRDESCMGVGSGLEYYQFKEV